MPTRASVEVLDRGFEEAVPASATCRRAGRIDVLVAAGSNGAFLRQHLDLPVVLVSVGGFDIMRALGRARELLVAHRDRDLWDGLAGCAAVQRTVRSSASSSAPTRRKRRRATACANCRPAASKSWWRPAWWRTWPTRRAWSASSSTRMDAVREALDDAVEIARVARIERAKRERLNTILGAVEGRRRCGRHAGAHRDARIPRWSACWGLRPKPCWAGD